MRYRDWSKEVTRQGIGAVGARQIADRLNKIQYNIYVEPLVGRGDIYRATRPAPTEVLADKDCRRVAQAKRVACRSDSSCARIKAARVSCGRDWKAYLKHDSPDALFVIDPPWTNVTLDKMKYRENSTITAESVVEHTKRLKGAVAIVYKNTPETRRVLCRKPFKCSLIKKNFFGQTFTQLLAVKQPNRDIRARANELPNVIRLEIE